ncbi:MAG: ferredoxin-thioredoxin reductase catalytic domain-containing protein [Desulfitobacteriaceae bacterium]
MSLKETLGMMKDFFSSYIKYHTEIKKQDHWIKKYAAQKGYKVNPHWMLFTNLKIWIIESEKAFGKRYCPCFEPSGSEELNKKLICPCKFVEKEIEERGTCHCVLFGRGDLTEADFKKAEQHLMQEYRVPLNFKDGVLDTRGMVRDTLRDLPIPDSLHQVKRVFGTGRPLQVIVATEAEARNLDKFAQFKNQSCRREDGQESFTVTFTDHA